MKGPICYIGPFKPKTNGLFAPLKGKKQKELFRIYSEELLIFYKEFYIFIVFSRVLKKNFDCLTFVSQRSFFFKNSLISLSLFQLADKVCKLTVRRVNRTVLLFGIK